MYVYIGQILHRFEGSQGGNDLFCNDTLTHLNCVASYLSLPIHFHFSKYKSKQSQDNPSQKPLHNIFTLTASQSHNPH
jgi:hypothetical protein